MDWSKERTRSPGGEATNFERLRFEEHVRLRNSEAFILDPRLVTFSLGGDLGLFRDRDTSGQQTIAGNGTLYGYSADVILLREKPTNVFLFANRNQGTTSREFAGKSDILTETQGATLQLQRLLSSLVSYRHETSEEESRFAGLTARRSEDRQIAGYQGAQSWETGDLNLRYEFTDVSDRVAPALSHQAHNGNVIYARYFGEDLEHSWGSSLSYFGRRGLTESSILTADESVRLVHTPRLSTTYRYLFSFLDVTGGRTLGHTGSANLTHRLFESLTTIAGLNGSLSDQPGGEVLTYNGTLDLGYRKKIPWGGTLLGGAGTSYRVNDNRFASAEVAVLRESHAVQGLLPILLNNRRIVPESMVVTDEAGTTIYQLGRDYTIRTFDESTEITILPLGRIATGRTILVDYRFSQPRGIKFGTLAWRTNIGADYEWIAFSYAHDQSDQSLLSGTDGKFLDDTRGDMLNLSLRWERPRLRLAATSEVRRQDSTRLAFDSYRFGQSASVLPRRDTVLSLTGTETLFAYRRPPRSAQEYVGRAEVSWNWWDIVTADGFTGIRVSQDSAGPDERSLESGIRFAFSLGKLNITTSFDYRDRLREGSRSRDFGVNLRIVRRFW